MHRVLHIAVVVALLTRSWADEPRVVLAEGKETIEVPSDWKQCRYNPDGTWVEAGLRPVDRPLVEETIVRCEKQAIATDDGEYVLEHAFVQKIEYWEWSFRSRYAFIFCVMLFAYGIARYLQVLEPLPFEKRGKRGETASDGSTI